MKGDMQLLRINLATPFHIVIQDHLRHSMVLGQAAERRARSMT
jgi:hypothetical protein